MTSSAPSPSQMYIRPALPSDSPALSQICLLTGDAGKSATHLHTHGELIGLVYAEPYVHLPATVGFVLIDPSAPSSHSGEEAGEKVEKVVGYALAAYDTRAFETAAHADWFPRVRAPYADSDTNTNAAAYTDADKHYIKTLNNPPRAEDVQVGYSPAHMHINILEEYQRQGWGRRLIARVVRALREERGLERMWLGISLRNEGAKRFYERLGFREVPGAPAGTLGLEFKDFEE